jgi:hypothetical protein
MIEFISSCVCHAIQLLVDLLLLLYAEWLTLRKIPSKSLERKRIEKISRTIYGNS